MGKANRSKKQRLFVTPKTTGPDANAVKLQKKVTKKEKLKQKHDSFIQKLSSVKKIADQEGFSFHELLETLNDPTQTKILPEVGNAIRKHKYPPSSRTRNGILKKTNKILVL